MPRKKHYNPEKMIHNRVASLGRENKRKLAKEQFDKQVAKEKAIGIDPIYDHKLFSKHHNPYEASKEWLKKSKQYDQEAIT